MAFIYDTGFFGTDRSMSNVPGHEGQSGRVYQANPQPGTDPVVILSPSPNRKWALVQNVGTVDVYLSLDAAFTDLGTVGIRLRPDGHILFNKEMDWTGGLYGRTLAGTASLVIWSRTVGLE